MLEPLKSFLDGDLQRVLKKENKNLLPFFIHSTPLSIKDESFLEKC